MITESLRSIIGISYEFNAGPMSMDDLIELYPPEQTNCQRAVQIFYANVFNVFLPPSYCLSYEGFWCHGSTIKDFPITPADAKTGDIIYAYHRNRKPSSRFDSPEYSLHIGVLIPGDDLVVSVYHSTPRLGTIIESWTEFNEQYFPIRMKRFLHGGNSSIGV